MSIVVWFSCGAASAVAAKLAVDKYGKENVRIVNNFIKEEHEDNRRFLKDVERWLGVTIESCVSEKYPNQSCVEVWAERKYMSGVGGAPCTGELKKKARQAWENKNNFDAIVLGFTVDEIKRHERFVTTERENVLPLLIEAGLTKQDCFRIIAEARIALPEIYKLGFPNANCIGCVKATSPTYWNHVRKTFPDVFEQRAKQSREIGTKLARHKGVRVFIDELPPEAQGAPMKDLYFECGLFCEEYNESK